MPYYLVTLKADGSEVSRYMALSVQSQDWPLELYEHTEWVPQAQGDDSSPAAPLEPITKLAYLRRFMQAERIAIRTAAQSDAVLQDYLELLSLAEEVRLDDPDIIAAVNLLETAGLIAEGRAAEILNG